MSCVYEAEPVSFSCVLDVVNDVRTGNVTTETARKILKQVDSGLAQFGKPKPIGLTNIEEIELLDAIESRCSMESKGTDILVDLLPLLLQLLTLVLNR